MQIGGHDIGVCSWSLQPRDADEFAQSLKLLSLSHFQLALEGLLGLEPSRRRDELAILRNAGTITAGMIAFPGEDYSSIEQIRLSGGFASDNHWPARRLLASQAARLASEIGLRQVSTHAGFLPPRSHARYSLILGRVRDAARDFLTLGVDLLFETGQESAAELIDVLTDLAMPNVGVNFDPANMILYGGGEPQEALRRLGRWVRHVHIKDATPSSRPGIDWGEEVPFGTGAVGAEDFLQVLHEVGYDGPLVIEREAGEERLKDVRAAIESLRNAATKAR